MKSNSDKSTDSSINAIHRHRKPQRESPHREKTPITSSARSQQQQESSNPRRSSGRPQTQASYQRIERRVPTQKMPRVPTPKPIYREERVEEAKPKPVGNMCSPSCPLFRCEKRALMIKLVDGKPQTFCTWVNDVCISYKCQYAFCSQRYLLPDGKCSAVLRSDKKEDAFLKELENLKDEGHLKSLLSRKGLGKDLLY
ncbi:MAG: hypothetical protein QXM55_00305 [Ignisphaera sp.]